MNQYSDKLRAYLDQNPMDYTDGDSLLEELHWCCMEANTFDGEEVRETFQKLYRSMPELSEDRFDEVFSAVSTLSAQQEKLAFQIGVKIGLRLAYEVMGK